MYRLITESLLGLRLEIDKPPLRPVIPPEWKSFKVHYRYRETVYHITLNNPAGGGAVLQITLDGKTLPDTAIPLVDDRKPHNVEIELGELQRVTTPVPQPAR